METVRSTVEDLREGTTGKFLHNWSRNSVAAVVSVMVSWLFEYNLEDTISFPANCGTCFVVFPCMCIWVIEYPINRYLSSWIDE